MNQPRVPLREYIPEGRKPRPQALEPIAPGRWATHDLNVAAFMASHGVPLAEFVQEATRTRFEFDDSAGRCRGLQIEWFNGCVESRFVEKQRALKTVVHGH